MRHAQTDRHRFTADRRRARSPRSDATTSERVRRTLADPAEPRDPDLAWIGSLRPRARISHDLDDIRAGVAAARRAQARLG